MSKVQAKVFVLERFSASALAKLRSELPDHEVRFEKSLPKNSEEVAETTALIVRSKTRVNADLMQRMPNLKLVVTATSGFDHIDLEEASKRDITVMYSPEGNATSAAELTWSLLLACARKIPQAKSMAKKNDWDRSSLLGMELSGKTIGLVGLGRVGSKVAYMANSFGLKVSYYDPYLEPEKAPPFAESMGFIELLLSSDIISFHVPLTKKTRHQLNHRTLDSIGGHPILLNTSRGAVISEDLLVKALAEGIISGAGLDVFEREPLAPDSRLKGFEQVICTPHIGATTNEAFEKVSMIAAEKTIAFIKQGVTSDQLPGTIPWLKDDSIGD